MPKVNPFSGVRPERQIFKREYMDEAFPGEVVTLYLRRPDSVDWGKIADLTQRKIKQYITGDEVDGTKAQVFQAVAEQWVELSEGLCSNVAIVTVMQHPESDADRYSFDEMVAVSVKYEQAWRDITREYRNIIKHGRPDAPDTEKNGHQGNGAGTAGTLEGSPSLSTTSASTPNTESVLTPSSAP